MEALSTIGYEGAALNDFLEALRGAGVTTLLDVRQAPTSRRPEFAKRQLAEALEEAGIAYRHEGALGAPKALRERLKQGECDEAEFFAGYEEHLATQNEKLDELVELPGHVALMCYERDVRHCHRRSVARALEQRTGLAARHLTPSVSTQRHLPL